MGAAREPADVAGGAHDTGVILSGGLANAGAVSRYGDAVRRPAPRNAPAVHAYFIGLAARGFDGAPTPIGMTTDGREELTSIPGEVPVLPYPAWALTGDALRSVGALIRRLHDVSADIPVDRSVGWPRELSDPQSGTMLVHNDVCLENVVFRDGRAVALIDFDFAAPGRPLWDVAMAARYWIPMIDPESSVLSGRAGLDRTARLRVLADGYGLSTEDRTALPSVIDEATAVARTFVADAVASGDPNFTEAFEAHGGWKRWDRIQAWLAAHRQEFIEALTS